MLSENVPTHKYGIGFCKEKNKKKKKTFYILKKEQREIELNVFYDHKNSCCSLPFSIF